MNGEPKSSVDCNNMVTPRPWMHHHVVRILQTGRSAKWSAFQFSKLYVNIFLFWAKFKASLFFLSDLCKSEYTKKHYQDPILMCRKSSTATCEGSIYKQIKRTIEDTNYCSGLNDDSEN